MNTTHQPANTAKEQDKPTTTATDEKGKANEPKVQSDVSKDTKDTDADKPDETAEVAESKDDAKGSPLESNSHTK